MVERLVAATTRRQSADAADDDTETTDDEDTEAADHHILPYRAGYEAEDRTHIHEALREGTLAGVVSTSALELGIDIGEISLAILLNSPPSVKSFWQRVGRAGRRQHGICLIIDDQALIDTDKGGLAAYIARSLEPNWLYLDNRYLQYANALCAALEVSDIAADQSSFGTLPTAFREFLDNEINPTQNVPPDLYVLKQRAQSEPHLEFPIRTGLEREFQITGPFMRLGRLTLSQLLREAYPGAVYYYLGRPYRVFRLQLGKGEAFAKREKTLTTKPIAQTMVFPDFKYGLLSLRSSTFGFLAEVHLQVSEIVRGFVEYRGMTKQEHRYGPDSEYYSRDLNRFFQTTGVCWYVPDRSALAEPTAQALLETFCTEYAVQSRDLGVGPFMTTTPPVGPERCQGICIYDSTYGSLRLTQRFAEQFERVLELSLNQALTREQHDLHRALNNLRSYVSDLRAATVTSELPHATAPDDPNWTQIIAPGATAMYMDAAGAREVEVVTVRYTPQGLMYELQHDNREVKWMTPVTTLQPLHGRTQFALFHLLTGEIRPLDEQAAS